MIDPFGLLARAQIAQRQQEDRFGRPRVYGPVRKSAPPKVTTMRELEVRRGDTRAARARRHRAASLGGAA